MMKNFLNSLHNEKKGVALYMSLLILSAVMAISASIASVLIGQFKISGDVQKAMNAVYAADSGIEKALYEVRRNGQLDIANVDCLNFGLFLPDGSNCTLDISGVGSGADVTITSKGQNSGFFRQIQALYSDL